MSVSKIHHILGGGSEVLSADLNNNMAVWQTQTYQKDERGLAENFEDSAFPVFPCNNKCSA